MVSAMKKAVISSILFVVVLLAGGVITEAQHRKNGQGRMAQTRSSASGTGLDRLRRHLRALGYIEGKNIAFEFRSADDKLDRLPSLADELVSLKVDVFVTPSTAETLAARNATRTIPIVGLNLGDPVALGLVDSLARPGGNTRDSPTSPRFSPANDWSYSRKPFPRSPALQCCGIRKIPVPRHNGKEVKSQHEDSASSFIPWRLPTLTNTSARSKRQSKREVQQLP